jgi:hypothetical protein
VRGLHFHHHNNCLPENLTTGVSVTVPDEEPPEHFKAFMGLPNNEEHGQYPGVFAYRFQNLTEAHVNAHYWATLFWDRIIITAAAAFHDPACPCEECHHPRR